MLVWKHRFMGSLLDVMRDFPDLRVKFQTRYLWFWSLFHRIADSSDQAFPESVGAISLWSNSVYLRGSTEEGEWQDLDNFQRFCYMHYLHEFLRLRREEGRLRFALKYMFWRPFRVRVKMACYFRVMCCYLQRYLKISYVHKVHFADAIWHSARQLRGMTWNRVFDWVDVCSKIIRRKARDQGTVKLKTTLDSLGTYGKL